MRVTLRRQTWVGVVLLVETECAVFLVEYDGSGFGEKVYVNGRLAVHQVEWLTLSLVAPRIEFELGSHPAAIEVGVWPWLAIRTFRLIVSGEIVYDNGICSPTSVHVADDLDFLARAEDQTHICVPGRFSLEPSGNVEKDGL